MLNLLSCLDFVFVFCVFNFVSCPSRHMRWKLFPDVSKDYCCSVSRVRINILKQLWCYNHSVTILLFTGKMAQILYFPCFLETKIGPS